LTYSEGCEGEHLSRLLLCEVPDIAPDTGMRHCQHSVTQDSRRVNSHSGSAHMRSSETSPDTTSPAFKMMGLGAIASNRVDPPAAGVGEAVNFE